MKPRIIKSHLAKVFADYVRSIDDPAVADLVKKGTIITGGAIASLLLKERPNDYDMYFRNKETALAVAGYYVRKFNENPPEKWRSGDGSSYEAQVRLNPRDEERVEVFIKSAGVVGEGEQYDDTDKEEDFLDEQLEDNIERVGDMEPEGRYRAVFLSTNAITLSNKVQLILRFYGEPQEIHDNYDFVHCTSYWTSWNGELVLPPKALEALLSKELVYVGSKYPIASLIRIRKFLKRDFTITAGTILKIVMGIDDLDLTDPFVLQDQLTGVDVTYFNQILHQLAEKNSEKIDKHFLIEIIDRMF